MEAGKPDQVGEMGEEAVGPLNLPRPKGSSWLFALWLVSIYAASGAISGSFGSSDVAFSLDSEAGIRGILRFVASMVFLGLWLVALKAWQRRQPRLRIDRSEIAAPAPPQDRIEIWSGDSPLERAIPLFASLLLGVLFGWLMFINPSKSVLMGYLLLAVFSVTLIYKLRDYSAPLLTLSKGGAQVRFRFLSWENVQAVEMTHDVDFGGKFVSVSLTFLGARNHRLAHISLPTERCGFSQEEALLSFIAARLGRRYEHLAPTAPDWL